MRLDIGGKAEGRRDGVLAIDAFVVQLLVVGVKQWMADSDGTRLAEYRRMVVTGPDSMRTATLAASVLRRMVSRSR